MRGTPFARRVAAGIWTRDSRVFLARRLPSDPQWSGCWDFPGGKVERGESIEQAVEREFMEELGIRATVVRQILFRVFPRRINLYAFVLHSDADLSEVRLLDHDQCGFFTLDEASALRPAMPSHGAIIEALGSSLS